MIELEKIREILVYNDLEETIELIRNDFHSIDFECCTYNFKSKKDRDSFYDSDKVWQVIVGNYLFYYMPRNKSKISTCFYVNGLFSEDLRGELRIKPTAKMRILNSLENRYTELFL